MSTTAWIVAAALGALLVAALVALARTLRTTRDDLATEREHRAEAERSVAHLESRTGTLRAELAEAHHTNAELTARLRRASTDPRTLGLWALERHRQARLAGTPMLATPNGPGLDVAAELRAAIALELELLREEVGTHGEVVEVSLGEPLEARDALAALRVVQELAAALAKRADELRVTIARDQAHAVVIVEAIGWADAPPSQAALAISLAALDGTLEQRLDAGTLVAVARLGSAGS
ncbi:MAG: hypothetical protein FJW88_08055 [Actinobacteria bacterium]|nr:hypothetical protein [Actinomycetota bacterium]